MLDLWTMLLVGIAIGWIGGHMTGFERGKRHERQGWNRHFGRGR
jgi:hypothetical protein